MSSYLPEKCFVVCTKQMGFGYKRLLIDGEVRSQVTVILKTGVRPFLTIADRKIDEDFACQSQWASVVAWGAFGAGAAVGVLVLASIPVIGWIGLGIVAAVAIGAALFGYFTNRTKCSDRLRSVGSKWIIFHPTVTFDGYNAVNKRSILQCQEGGTLLPFIDESLAADAAQAIAWRNLADVTINGLATFVSGLFAVLAFGEMAAWKAVAWFAGGMLFGQVVINPATDAQREYMQRHNPLPDNETYRNMNEDVGDGGDKDVFDYLRPDNEWNPKDFQEVYSDLRDVRRRAIENGASREHIAELDRALKSAERTGSFSAKKNPAMRSVVENIKSGKYGTAVQEQFRNRSGNMRGMNRRANYERAISSKNESVRANQRANRTGAGKVAGNLLQIIQPFASTYFSEKARQAAAIYAEQDMGNGVGVIARDN